MYLPDALGSVRVTLNSAGDVLATHRYDPYGTPQLGDVPRTFGFTGEPHDTTGGLVHLRARWYATAEGRLLTRDPFMGFAQRPYTQHPYAYALSNPSNFTDPSGRCVFGLDTIVCVYAGVGLFALAASTLVATQSTIGLQQNISWGDYDWGGLIPLIPPDCLPTTPGGFDELAAEQTIILLGPSVLGQYPNLRHIFVEAGLRLSGVLGTPNYNREVEIITRIDDFERIYEPLLLVARSQIESESAFPR
jgi:RHS repeat-associated protein